MGRTGLEVGALSLGAAFATRGEAGFDGAKNIIFEALELGLNLIDTSADYATANPLVFLKESLGQKILLKLL